MKKTKLKKGTYVRVDGTGFINGIIGLTRVAEVLDYNEDGVQVSFLDSEEEDWFTGDQVDISYHDNQRRNDRSEKVISELEEGGK